MDRGFSLPHFKKLEKEAASWKKKYDATAAQNEALVAEVTALKASITVYDVFFREATRTYKHER
jgi:hypothetical protein